MSGVTQDGTGKTSSMRIAFLATVLTACGVALLGVILKSDLAGIGLVVGALLAPAFGGKALQARGGT